MVYDPFTTRQDPANPNAYVRDALPGNRIPASRFDTFARNLAQKWPKPLTSTTSRRPATRSKDTTKAAPVSQTMCSPWRKDSQNPR